MKAEIKHFKIEVEYSNQNDLIEIVRQLKGWRNYEMQILRVGTAKAQVTHGKVSEIKDETEFIELVPDRIEKINGKTHYIYKSKM